LTISTGKRRLVRPMKSSDLGAATDQQDSNRMFDVDGGKCSTDPLSYSLKMEAEYASETLVPIFETARRHIPVRNNFHDATFVDPLFIIIVVAVVLLFVVPRMPLHRRNI
jgi:hypothetical protein